MNELTAYFPTTDRVHAQEALRSLNAQGIPRPVVVVRNVRPLCAAYLPTLECQTPYCLVLDDDTVLRLAVVQPIMDRFRAMRAVQPSGFKLSARVYSEARSKWDVGGFKLFYLPHLVKVGWPDAPHVSFAQKRIADRLGFIAMRCDIEAGVQKRGSDLDVYKKFLWIELRAQAGQLGPLPLPDLVQRARAGPPWLWFAVLGLLDGKAVGRMVTSKDEHFLGPIGRTLDFCTASADDVRRTLTARGLIEAM
jgi:hypothetical protein